MPILGLRSRRTVQAMAARGEIPSAAISGGRWTFNVAALRAWVRDRERETWERNARLLKDVSGTKKASGARPWSMESASDGRSIQLIRKLRANVASKP
jgi:hypothetical protein